MVVRQAKETSWGCGRIVGELKKLRIQSVGRTPSRKNLKEEGIHPGPQRGPGMWHESVKTHAETLWLVDFFTKSVVTKTRIKLAFVLAFLRVRSRRVICSPATFHLNSEWAVGQAEQFLQQAEESSLPARFLVRDKDFKYSRGFGKVFEEADVAVEPTSSRSPNQNALFERWIDSITSECLKRFICSGIKHLDYLVEEYVRY